MGRIVGGASQGHGGFGDSGGARRWRGFSASGPIGRARNDAEGTTHNAAWERASHGVRHHLGASSNER